MAVIETNEWNNKTQANWVYSGTVIDPAPIGGSSPSSGSALKMTYPAGTYLQSTGGGRAEYTNLTGQELYIGHWMKWSSGFTWNPVGTKIDYLKALTTSTVISTLPYITLRTGANGTGLKLDVGIQGNGAFSHLPHVLSNNDSFSNFQTNRWYWFEFRSRLNTVGLENGVVQVWVDAILVMSHSNLAIIDQTNSWRYLQHSPEWGGSGGTIPVTQYYWVDHSVISTTPIGMPGGSPQPDVTPPTIPTGLMVN